MPGVRWGLIGGDVEPAHAQAVVLAEALEADLLMRVRFEARRRDHEQRIDRALIEWIAGPL